MAEQRDPLSGAEWEPSCRYLLGDVVVWTVSVPAARLICTRAHYAGDKAAHPWDAGWGWAAATAATLWTPTDEVASAHLAALAQAPDEALPDLEADSTRHPDGQRGAVARLREVMLLAAVPEFRRRAA